MAGLEAAGVVWRKGLAIGAVALLVGVSLTPAEAAWKDDWVPTYTMGEDEVVHVGMFNFHAEGTECTEETCEALASGYPTASASAGLAADETGDIQRQVWIGHEYDLVKACADQPQPAQMTATFDYTYDLSTEVGDDGRAKASLTHHVQATDDEDTPAKLATAGQDLSGDEEPNDVAVETFPEPGERYRTSLGVHAEVADRTYVGGETLAEADVELRGFTLTFGDDTSPNSSIVGVESEDDSPEDVVGDFEGVFEEPVTVTIATHDPRPGEGEGATATSCVEYVWIWNDVTEEYRSVEVGFDQEPVSTTFHEPGEYDLYIYAEDHNDNNQVQPTQLGFAIAD